MKGNLGVMLPHFLPRKTGVRDTQGRVGVGWGEFQEMMTASSQQGPGYTAHPPASDQVNPTSQSSGPWAPYLVHLVHIVLRVSSRPLAWDGVSC